MLLNGQTKILIVGLGLIGGSYAEGLSHIGFEVGGLDIDPHAVECAKERGWITKGQTQPTPAFLREYDLIVFAIYPKALLRFVSENQAFFKKGALLTDVTGVKVPVVYDVQAVLREDLEFVGAHPMAGREQSGIENADRSVFFGANYIVTPTGKNTHEGVETAKQLGRLLGFSTVKELTPERHDETVGFLSQLTHCIAVALMTGRDTAGMEDYSGDSFRDLTRIAKINDEMWSELFLLNRDELLRQMDLFRASFDNLYRAVRDGEREPLREQMRESAKRRGNFDKKPRK